MKCSVSLPLSSETCRASFVVGRRLVGPRPTGYSPVAACLTLQTIISMRLVSCRSSSASHQHTYIIVHFRNDLPSKLTTGEKPITYNQQLQNLHNHSTNAQTNTNEVSKAWYWGLLRHLPRNLSGSILLQYSTSTILLCRATVWAFNYRQLLSFMNLLLLTAIPEAMTMNTHTQAGT